MKRCISCLLALMISLTCLCPYVMADGAESVPDESLIALIWEDTRIEVSASQWDALAVRISTEDAGLGDGRVYDYVGVKLSDLMALAGADECTKALVKSSDGLVGEVSAEDIRNYEIALVNGYADGTALKAGVGGPVKIVFPISGHPELMDVYTPRFWQWYVCEVAFTKPSAEERAPASAAPAVNETSDPADAFASPAPGGMEEPAGLPSVQQTGEAHIPAGAAALSFGHAERCVIIVLDAFSAAYLPRLGPDSHIARLAADGTSCLSARSTYPTHTCTNHATIMTGVGAAGHGIVGNDRLGEDGFSSVKNILPEMIRVPTLFQIVSAAGKKTAFVSGKDNMVTLFSDGLDVGVSNRRVAAYLPAAPELTDSSDNTEYYQYNMDLADWVFESLLTVLEKENPDLTVVNIQSTDYIAHRFGPASAEMDACLHAVDERLGELYRKMGEAGMLDHTAVIVTADHGMTPADKAIPLTALTVMQFPGAGSVIDGRNGYIWYGTEDREEVVRFFKGVEGIRNVFERTSNEASALNVNFPDGPDLFLETEPGYVFLPEPLLGLYHGQHGSRDDSDTIVPIVCFGAGIPSAGEIAQTDLRCIAPLVCHLLGLAPGSFDLGVPAVYEAQ